MHLVTGWVESKSGRLVSMGRDVITRATSYRQSTDHDAEAGGLLLGLRRGQNIEVKWLTVPQKTDTQERFGFFRERLGHAAEALERWYATGAQADYVGEWHTHPEPHPTPSNIDMSEWLNLASARKDRRPLFFMIVGTEGYYACLCHGKAILSMTPLEYQ